MVHQGESSKLNIKAIYSIALDEELIEALGYKLWDEFFIKIYPSQMADELSLLFRLFLLILSEGSYRSEYWNVNCGLNLSTMEIT